VKFESVSVATQVLESFIRLALLSERELKLQLPRVRVPLSRTIKFALLNEREERWQSSTMRVPLWTKAKFAVYVIVPVPSDSLNTIDESTSRETPVTSNSGDDHMIAESLRLRTTESDVRFSTAVAIVKKTVLRSTSDTVTML
jgi:hypothetical protein